MQIPRPLLVRPLLIVCLLAGLGCDGSGEKTVSVTGKVTHNDQPVAGIVVSFVPQVETKTGVSTGQTDDNGNYKLKVARTGSSGAVVGTHKVWVSLPRTPPEPVDKEERAKLRKLKKGTPANEKTTADLAAILKKYGNLEKTPLTVEVKGGESIDLKLD
ncbi:MAG TPA: hypothetical protein VE999_19785 [Gemmataceae bacterium]|nr:hypothetical protein [Gemmataceae bacterium]